MASRSRRAARGENEVNDEDWDLGAVFMQCTIASGLETVAGRVESGHGDSHGTEPFMGTLGCENGLATALASAHTACSALHCQQGRIGIAADLDTTEGFLLGVRLPSTARLELRRVASWRVYLATSVHDSHLSAWLWMAGGCHAHVGLTYNERDILPLNSFRSLGAQRSAATAIRKDT